MKKKLLLIVVVLLVIGAILVPGIRYLDRGDSAKQSEPIQEANYVSDPVYGNELTQEELDELKEEDEVSEEGSSITIGSEFVIELGENQSTGGF